MANKDDTTKSMHYDADDSLGVMKVLYQGSPRQSNHAIFLFDYRKWGPIIESLDQWLEENGAWREGSMVFYNDPAFYLLLKLTWS